MTFRERRRTDWLFGGRQWQKTAWCHSHHRHKVEENALLHHQRQRHAGDLVTTIHSLQTWNPHDLRFLSSLSSSSLPTLGLDTFASRPKTVAHHYSPRVLALLIRKGLIPRPNVALVVVPPGLPGWIEKNPMKDPPEVITTPCDPWPRPYYLEDGLRRVAPYHFTYNTNCKERWRGLGLLDIFTSEFRDRPAEYYKDAIERGMVTVNGKPVETVNHLVKNGDVISHTLHRHEPPVSNLPIGIIHEDDDIIVINKPAGIPVHPAGRYNYNSIVEIMRAQRGHQWNPLPCNRLDRLTSGVMFIGKHRKAAEKLTEQIMARTVKKEYVARVKGEFPEGDIVCDKPILQISPKLGLNRVRANGKASRTVFKRLAYYPPSPATENRAKSQQTSTYEESSNAREGYSIVRCLPVTGRTHQIRVHLQYLGHPILNDPIYCNQRVWGIDLGANDEDASRDTDEDIITRLSKMGKSEVAEAVAYHDEMVEDYNKKRAEKMSGELCEICDTPLYTDPGAHELGIYLHALRYEDMGGTWSYCSELPAWALPPAGFQGPTEVGAIAELVAADISALKPDEFAADE